MRRAGSTLVELLVYLALFGFAAYVFISSNTVLQSWYAWATTRAHSQLAQELAMDVLMRDLASASHKKDDWDMKKGVFKRQILDQRGVPIAYDVCYTCSGEGLLRVQGVYDRQRGGWRTHTTASVPCVPVRNISLQPVLDASGMFVTHVQVRLACKTGQEMSEVVRIRAGRLG